MHWYVGMCVHTKDTECMVDMTLLDFAKKLFINAIPRREG